MISAFKSTDGDTCEVSFLDPIRQPAPSRPQRPLDFEALATAPLSMPTALTLPTLAYLVHLPEGSVALLRDDDSEGAWRRQFKVRLRTCGPWDEEQVLDYLIITYGSDCAQWPFSKSTVARVFNDPNPARQMAIARDTPAVHAHVSSSKHRICVLPRSTSNRTTPYSAAALTARPASNDYRRWDATG